MSNTIETFPVPRSDAYLDVSGGITLGSDGGLWFLVGDSPDSQPTAIERFDPVTHAYTSFPFADPIPAGSFDSVALTELTSGPDGNIWFTLPYTDRIGRFDVTTDAFTLFTTPTAGSEPEFITSGPDDALWFTELSNNQIGRIDARTGAITEYVVPQPADLPPDVGVNYLFQGITAGADGGIWFTEPTTGQIGRIDPTTKAVTELDIPGNAQALTITAGPDGNLWFPLATGMGEVDLANDTVATFDAPNGSAAPGVPFSSARSMAVGSDGGLWINTYHSFDIMDDIRFDPQTKTFSVVQSYGPQGAEQMQLTAGPGAIVYGLDTGANSDGDGHQPQSIDAVIPTVETTTQLSASPSGTTLGQYVTFTAVVSPTNPIPGVAPLDGSVTLMVDGQVAQLYGAEEPVQLQSVNGQYVATFFLDDLAIGTHDVVASYGGSEPPYTTYAASDSADLKYTVGVVPTHTIIEEYPVTADPGQPVSFQAIVGDTNPNGYVVPDQFDGSIIFTVDGVAQPPIPLSLNDDYDSAASLTLTTLGSGNHFVSAAYGGGATFGPSSTDQPAEVTINGPALAPTITTLTGTPAVGDFGQLVTFTAIVGPQDSSLDPSGLAGESVAFAIDGDAPTTAPLRSVDGQEVATVTTSALAAGDHAITAAYGGDSTFAASSSSPVDVTIDAPALAGTMTTLTRSPGTAALPLGQLVTFTAIVSEPDTGGDDSALADGSVAFTIDGGAPTTAPLQWENGQAVATLATSGLPPGYHTVQADYSGTGRFGSSVSNGVGALIEAPSAAPAPTVTTLNAPPATPVVGQPLSFTAIVGPQDSSLDRSSLTGGSVAFTIDGGAPTTVSLRSVGGQEVATLTTSSLAAGTHTVTASFAGDPTFAPSASNGVKVDVAAPSPTPTPTATPTTSSPIPVAPADGPRVMDLQRFGYHAQPTVLVLTFDEALDPATASNPTNYIIVPLGPRGKDGRAIAIARVRYNAEARTVTLRPSRRLNVHDRFELLVDGTSTHAVVDAALRALDGSRSGRAGSDYVGKIDWSAIAGPSLPGERYARAWRKLVAGGGVGQ